MRHRATEGYGGWLVVLALSLVPACLDNSVAGPDLGGPGVVDDAPQQGDDDDPPAPGDPAPTINEPTDDDQAPGDPVVENPPDPVDPRDGPGVFVAVGYGGRRMISRDGTTWTDDQSLVTNGNDDDYLLRAVTYGNGQFVTVGWRLMTSPDGKDWTDHGVDAFGNWGGNVVYAKNKFVSLGGYGMRMSSADGLAWAEKSIDTTATHPQDGVAFAEIDGGIFVSNNDSGVRSYSTDGVTWHFATEGDTTTPTTHMAFGGDALVAIGGKDVLRSTDGMSWTKVKTLAADAQGLVYAQEHFTALADGHAFTSTDGITWEDHASAAISGANIVYGHGSYVIIGWQATRRSSDAITWDSWVSTGTNNSLVSMCFAPGL